MSTALGGDQEPQNGANHQPTKYGLVGLSETLPGSATRNKEVAMADRHGQAGFTLIEIIVVVFILGMLAALVGPQII